MFHRFALIREMVESFNASQYIMCYRQHGQLGARRPRPEKVMLARNSSRSFLDSSSILCWILFALSGRDESHALGGSHGNGEMDALALWDVLFLSESVLFVDSNLTNNIQLNAKRMACTIACCAIIRQCLKKQLGSSPFRRKCCSSGCLVYPQCWFHVIMERKTGSPLKMITWLGNNDRVGEGVDEATTQDRVDDVCLMRRRGSLEDKGHLNDFENF